MKIDMHFHSRHSDGGNDIDNLATEALKRQLEFVCITDHDLVNDDFVQLARSLGLRTSYSTEISVKNPHLGVSMHLTFYARQISKAVREVLEHTTTQKKLLIVRQIEKFQSHGLPIDLDAFYRHCISANRDIKTLNKYDICLYIYQNPELKALIPALNDGEDLGLEDFYARFLKRQGEKFPQFAAVIDEYEPNLTQIHALTQPLGGILSVAHPNVTFKNSQSDFLSALPVLISEAGVNAIEINSQATKERIDTIISAKETYGLYLTFGSDCHYLGHRDAKHGDFGDQNPYISSHQRLGEVQKYLRLLGGE